MKFNLFFLKPHKIMDYPQKFIHLFKKMKLVNWLLSN